MPGSRLTMRIWCVLVSLMIALPFWRTRLPDGQQPGGQVEVFPAEAEQLAASRAGDEG
ncbi:MAG: hypothetical protein ACRDRD_22435 [Pseudonocardiaceae bacterium]